MNQPLKKMVEGARVATPVAPEKPARALVSAVAPEMATASGKDRTKGAEAAALELEANILEGKGYTLKVGEYVLLSEVAEAKRKVQKASLSAVVLPGPKKKVQMTRLFVDAPTDQETARKELEKVRHADGVGIILTSKEGKHRVCAGSFFNVNAAQKEQQRLASLGIKTSQQHVATPVPTYIVTAGRFTTRDAASRQEIRLAREGLHAAVMELEK